MLSIIGSFVISLLLLPYWPGGSNKFSAEPTYPHSIPVIDTLGVQVGKAIKEWNACGSVQLHKGPQSLAETPGTITILDGLDELPRGGWTGDHGVLFLPAGSWTRSIPVIRHELGHALGFGHTKLWRIMGGSNHVQRRDCNGLVRYYGR